MLILSSHCRMKTSPRHLKLATYLNCVPKLLDQRNRSTPVRMLAQASVEGEAVESVWKAGRTQAVDRRRRFVAFLIKGSLKTWWFVHFCCHERSLEQFPP